jgi:HAD superfamily hydrolase (TIGR01509 family)
MRIPSDRRGLFLDLDGTLANSLGLLRDVYFRFLGKFGVQGSDAEFNRLNGPSLSEIVRILETAHSLPSDATELLAAYNRIVDEAYKKVLPKPGSRELIETAAAKGWVISLVTSNLESRACAWLERVGFDLLMEFVVSGEQVERGKPWPDLYELALARSGCVNGESMAAEDSVLGAKAARAAGLRTFLLTYLTPLSVRCLTMLPEFEV